VTATSIREVRLVYQSNAGGPDRRIEDYVLNPVFRSIDPRPPYPKAMLLPAGLLLI
jgi:hypothetical protein